MPRRVVLSAMMLFVMSLYVAGLTGCSEPPGPTPPVDPGPPPPKPPDMSRLSEQDRQVGKEIYGLRGSVRLDDGGQEIVEVHLAGLSNVDDAALQSICRVASIRKMYIDSTGVTDAGMAHVAALENLTHLDVSGTAVTDAGLDHLKSLTNLRTLILRGNSGISQGKKDDLRKAMSKILITGP